MSKPKPGLGKGIVRTLSHAHPSSSTSSTTHGPISHRDYATATRSTVWEASGSRTGWDNKSKEGYNAGSSTRRDSSASFASIGLPSSSVSIGSPGATSPWLSSSSTTNSSSPSTPSSSSSTWDGDIVTPFRSTAARLPLKQHHRPSGRATFSTTSSPNTLSVSLNMAPAIHSSLTGGTLNLNQLFWNPYLEAVIAKLKNSTFSDYFSTEAGSDAASSSIDFPTISGTLRPDEMQTALSPLGNNSSSTTFDPVFSPAFGTLGLPYQSSFEPIVAAPLASENSGLNLYSSNLIFHLGASGLAKERPVYPGRPRPQSAPPPPRPRSFPLPEVTPPLATDIRSTSVGEDAYFARMDGMCIADGVGGWARSGRGDADAGRWSRLLTHFCEREVTDWWAGAGAYAVKAPSESNEDGKNSSSKAASRDQAASGWASKAWRTGRVAASEVERVEEAKRRPLDPVEIMQRGFEKCLSCVLSEGIHGSSTCLLALLHHSTLLVANVGDCCLLLIRGGDIVLRTDEMQHAFNFPLQLGTHSRDEPMKDAKRYDIPVRKGDVVVVGSDGLMDNLFDEDILDTLAQFASPVSGPEPGPSSSRPTTPGGLPPFSPQKVSEALCKRARAVSEETSATSPFMVKAIEEGIDFVGGKKDDISVLVGVIGNRDESGAKSGLALHTE
ncbi:phosphatase 2C-like domain-containing protein [Kockovaella imperatae]|uniref:Protein phosphatase n=1 Tax=Kockovaella imperatae TaxID=4999 RepID=A0A1Y1UCW4_9TREE|nr:phosphatase 2C-like domain-containing protein [Kockovaella imperatae]ORX34915.1 phosphatase 2C-like domain-containing protein [Kockovaella imperatae]